MKCLFLLFGLPANHWLAWHSGAKPAEAMGEFIAMIADKLALEQRTA